MNNLQNPTFKAKSKHKGSSRQTFRGTNRFNLDLGVRIHPLPSEALRGGKQTQQFTYGVVWKGVIAENVLQISLVGREVQKCKLKKLSIFMENVCLSNGHIERFPAHRHSEFSFVPWWIFWLNFSEAVFRWHLLFLVQKKHTHTHTPKIRGQFRWRNPMKAFHFSVLFSVRFFRYVFRHAFFSEQLFASKSRNSHRIRSAREIP